MIIEPNGFFTQKGYDDREITGLSPTGEDYLEMIARCAGENTYVRVKKLASLLHVTPPSASKMAVRLKAEGYVDFEPYDVIRLTGKGREIGRFLLERHDVLVRFFCRLNQTESELVLVERIEHYIDRRTLSNMKRLLSQWESVTQGSGFSSRSPEG